MDWMDDRWRQRHEAALKKGAMKMHKTLLSAVRKAGGAIDFCQWEQLEGMTVKELLMVLGNNHVRFVYRKPRVKNQ